MFSCTPASSSEPSRLPSEEAVMPKDLIVQEDKTRKKVYVSQRPEELNNIEDSNLLGKTAADEGWNDLKSRNSSIVSHTYSETSNLKHTENRFERRRHRQSEDSIQHPKPNRHYSQWKPTRSKSSQDRISPKLRASNSNRTSFSKSTQRGSKYTPQSQGRPMTCPSASSKFTFDSRTDRSTTKDWAQLVKENRYKKNNVELQSTSFCGYDPLSPNLWAQTPSFDTWDNISNIMPYGLSTPYEADEFYLDGIPMPPRSISPPPSPMSPPVGLSDPIQQLPDYISGLNRINASSKNPDAFVMNTPAGHFIKGRNGKWFPMTQESRHLYQESITYEEAILEETRDFMLKNDLESGTSCKEQKEREARAEFVAAITKAAEEPTFVEDALE